MAKKPDPSAPKGRVKPGTPSKLLKGKVFGYHGKYVWKTTFDAQTKAREAVKKSSALVKRGTSAITNTTKAALAKAPKGKIIKINKGDSAVVKAAKRAYNAGSRTRNIVNKIYKAGQTTRKNVETVYNAGKEARKIHDKVVKGGKDVVKGAYEGGKDTKRAVNRLKPGGKIVKSEGGAITKYAKKPTSIVKTKGSKLTPYKTPSKGKLATRGKVTPTTPKKTPVSQRRTNAKLKIEQFKKGTTKDTAFNRKYKVRGSSTNPWKTNKKCVITNAYDWNKAKKFANKTIQKGVNLAKSPRALKVAKGIGKVGGVVEKITLPIALWQQTGQHINQLKNLGVVPGSGNFGKRLTFDQKNVRDTGSDIHNRIYEAKKKRLAKADAKSKADQSETKTKYDKSKKGNQTTTKVNNNNKLTARDKDDIRKENELATVLANKNKSGGSTTKVSDNKTVVKSNEPIVKSGGQGNQQRNQKPKDTRGKEAGTYAAGYVDGKSQKKKNKLWQAIKPGASKRVLEGQLKRLKRSRKMKASKPGKIKRLEALIKRKYG